MHLQAQQRLQEEGCVVDIMVVLHETLHEIHTKKLDGVVFKVDFEKAYKKVKWPFLQQALRMKEICPRGNNKVVIHISLYHDKCLLFMLELYYPET